jgi:hypothetical protein
LDQLLVHSRAHVLLRRFLVKQNSHVHHLVLKKVSFYNPIFKESLYSLQYFLLLSLVGTKLHLFPMNIQHLEDICSSNE